MNRKVKNSILNNLQKLKYMGFQYIEPVNLSVNENNIGELSIDIAGLENMILNCNLCSFSKTRKNVLIGSGNLNAKVVFLNMAPSQLENDAGKLLVGNNGDMLKNMCENVLGISIDDVYMMNILKCIPNKNILECNHEINTCKPYFQKQLDTIKPQLIVSFGDSYKYLGDDQKDLSTIRGTMQYYNNIKVIPTYDPSFILRNPSLKQDVLEDLKKVKSIMESF